MMKYSHLQTFKEKKQKIACLSLYDATFSKIAIAAGVDVLLVGDSLGMVVQGKNSTLSVTMEDICYHLKAVQTHANDNLLIADMPFMSYSSLQQTLNNAATLVRHGANMVKLEGGDSVVDYAYNLSSKGIPVCAHLGLTPQFINKIGGYKMQATTAQAADELKYSAKSLEQAGADMLILEMVPQQIAAKITSELSIPVIGIGAGSNTDGQILVVYDLLGMSINNKIPSFAKNFLINQSSIEQAIATYVQDIKESKFPSSQNILQ